MSRTSDPTERRSCRRSRAWSRLGHFEITGLLANVASLLIDGRSIWFHSVNTPRHVTQIFDYVEILIGADRFLPAPPELASHVFNFYDWDTRRGC